MSKIGIFIPCYNVENSIRDVLSSFSEETLSSIAEIVVTDNCSQDNTIGILKEIQASESASGHRLTILKNSENYGLGGSQKIAYQYFIDNGFDYFFIIHGDNQTNGEEIAKKFLSVLGEGQTPDVIITSRFAKGADTSEYDRLRLLGNHFFNFLTFVLTGIKMTDSGAGVMCVRTEALRRFPFFHLTNSFQFNPQLNILYYSDKDLNIVEVPLKWSDSKEESNIKAINYCWMLLKILVRYRWRKTFLKRSGWQLFNKNSMDFTPIYDVMKSQRQEPLKSQA